jgi:hypothetical protein
MNIGYEKEDLCPKRNSDYLKPTEDPRKLICDFCGQIETIWTLKDIEELERSGHL